MKHYLIICTLIFLFYLDTSAQSVQCYPDQSDIFWLISSQHGSKRLSNCDSQATYNCHGFAMAMMENTCGAFPSCCTIPSWNTTVNTPYLCPNNKGIADYGTWQNDNRYVRVSSEADAKLVFFQISQPGGHTAVKTTSPFGASKYMSKYGFDGPLVAHDLSGSVYHLKGQYIPNTMEYWTYVGAILGATQIEIGSNYSYNVQAATGVTYSWSSVNSKFNIVSGNGTHSVTLTPTQSGLDVLKLITTGISGQSKTQYYNLNILPPCLEGTYSSSLNPLSPLYTVNSVPQGQIITNILCQATSSIQWTHSSGSAPYWIWNNNNVLIQMPIGGSISFKVDAKSASGQTIKSRNITFYNFGSFMVYPNPSSGKFEMDLAKDYHFEIEVINLNDVSRRSKLELKGGDSIDISFLPNGEYWLKVLYKGTVINEQRIILKK